MKHIILYGHLGKRFGKHHYFDVRTPNEAIRALNANYKGFTKHILDNDGLGYHVKVGSEYRDVVGLSYPVDGTIRIVPAVGGASAEAKILIGAALLIAAPYAAGWVLANTTMVSVATTMATMLPQIGLALVLGGVANLLLAPKPAETVEPPKSAPSYAFNGPVNTVTQGNAVPVCYGRLIVGSQVVSASMSASDIPV